MGRQPDKEFQRGQDCLFIPEQSNHPPQCLDKGTGRQSDPGFHMGGWLGVRELTKEVFVSWAGGNVVSHGHLLPGNSNLLGSVPDVKFKHSRLMERLLETQCWWCNKPIKTNYQIQV